MYIDNELVWHIDWYTYFEVRDNKYPLMSDSRFREDLVNFKYNNEDLA